MPGPSATAASSAPPPLLTSRRFTPLFFVQALGAFNDNVFKNAFIALITFQLAAQLEMGVALLGAIAAGVFILPFALFAPVAGEIADRVDKAKMMRWVKAAEIVLMILASIAFFAKDVFFLYVLLFLMGAQSAFFGPIKYGVLPQYLGEDELVRGNGFVQAGTFMAILAGTIVGTNLVLTDAGVLATALLVLGVAVIGFVASLFAPSAPPAARMAQKLSAMCAGAVTGTLSRSLGGYGAFAGLWLLTAVAIAAFAPNEGPLAGEAPTMIAFATLFWAAIALLWPTMMDSVSEARATPDAWRAILAISWFWFVGATFMSLLPDFTKIRLGGDETVLTLLLSSFSIGVAVGAVLVGLLFRGAIRIGVAPWGAAMIGLFSIDLMFATGPAAAADAERLQTWSEFLATPAGWRVLIDFVGLAIGAGIYVTPLNAVYQHASPPGARGRIVATSNMVDSAFMVISSIVVIILLEMAFSTEAIYAVIGATGFGAAFVMARHAPETYIGAAALAIWPRRTEE